MQRSPSRLEIGQVDLESRNLQQDLDPVQRPGLLLHHGEVQNGPPEVVPPVHLGKDGLFLETASCRESRRAGTPRRSVLTSRCTATTASSSSSSIVCARATRTDARRSASIDKGSSLCDRSRGVESVEIDVAHKLTGLRLSKRAPTGGWTLYSWRISVETSRLGWRGRVNGERMWSEVRKCSVATVRATIWTSALPRSDLRGL